VVDERFRKAFPSISEGVEVTSPETPEYNCFAWAVGRTDEWWEPGRTWPIDTSSEWTVETLRVAFETQGFSMCADGDLEEGFEKIAIYCDVDGEPTHAAKLLANGRWSSKVGTWEDVEHTLADLAGVHPAYGAVDCYMKRPVAPAPPPQQL
jgi:hypothetical protein